ncbi:MAG: hypothetical protein JJT85_04645 [Chromatiales bacterium]|nr:hypothetical protein [Chromatiales bacterium]
MARTYRQCRRGEIPPEDLSRFIYALSMIGKVIEVESVEQRLDRLEALAGSGQQPARLRHAAMR